MLQTEVPFGLLNQIEFPVDSMNKNVNFKEDDSFVCSLKVLGSDKRYGFLWESTKSVQLKVVERPKIGLLL